MAKAVDMGFSIHFDWLPCEWGNAIDRSTSAEIVISVNEKIATEAEDRMAKTVRPAVRVSAYALARWLASNWWRLRWEPERTSLDWQMSHNLGAAGDGFLWPNLSFISDGKSLIVRSMASDRSSKQPLRYLEDFDALIPIEAFEREIARFIDAVIERLNVFDVKDNELSTIWRETREECSDPETVVWRRIEAVLGFDPDEASSELIEDFRNAERIYGEGAVEEMAAQWRSDALQQIRDVWDKTKKNAFAIRIPKANELRSRIRNEIAPTPVAWRMAEQSVQAAREAWGLTAGAVSDSDFNQLFSIANNLPSSATFAKTPMNVGFRNGTGEELDIALKSPFEANRRFAIMRLVGDHLVAAEDDKLLPALAAFTYRQKFQRAFAQEFLCPYSELQKFVPQNPTDEDIQEAALRFGVSELTVKTTLTNKGHVPRDRFIMDFPS